MGGIRFRQARRRRAPRGGGGEYDPQKAGASCRIGSGERVVTCVIGVPFTGKAGVGTQRSFGVGAAIVGGVGGVGGGAEASIIQNVIGVGPNLKQSRTALVGGVCFCCAFRTGAGCRP